MDAKLSLLVLLVVCLQSTQVNGGRCGKKKQCCPQISNVVQCPPCPGSEADPTDLTPPMLYLNFTESSEGVELMNSAEQDESGLKFNRADVQFALLDDSLHPNATCILFPSECPNGFTVSMLVDVEDCRKGIHGNTMGFLTTANYDNSMDKDEGINIKCETKRMQGYFLTDQRKYSVENIKVPDTTAKIRMTFVLVEETGLLVYFNGKKQEGKSTKEFFPTNKNIQGNFAVGIGLYGQDTAYGTLEGTFADLVIWNRTLTEKEVQAIGTTDQY